MEGELLEARLHRQQERRARSGGVQDGGREYVRALIDAVVQRWCGVQLVGLAAAVIT